MNTNSVAPAAVCGTLIQSNHSFDCLTFLVERDQIVLVYMAYLWTTYIGIYFIMLVVLITSYLAKKT